MIESRCVTVMINGKGKTKDEAVSRALSKIQKQIFDKLDQLIIRAEPKSMEEVEATIEEYTERFLFFFLPRRRMKCSVTLKVEVNLKTMNAENLNWQTKTNCYHVLRRETHG
ncbi:DUF4312 family protein [Virgibacillus proomii]|uniref:DUF4312 family protein n=1 Tax=Virgibacillus proomii TaxID=84407 RepID=UPI001C113183|nr:DUF4312 family protein [Virgibacillus proomii]MBU5266696.1 DUF4312 family protein [Virgibacillus proomii]